RAVRLSPAAIVLVLGLPAVAPAPAWAEGVTEFSQGITAGGGPTGITVGPDGNLWFTEHTGDHIGRITPDDVVTEFGAAITAGSPDGNLWFTEYAANRVARITPQGVVTEASVGITPGSGPWWIAAGPDGNLWFTEHAGGRIGRMDPFYTAIEFSAGISPGSRP